MVYDHNGRLANINNPKNYKFNLKLSLYRLTLGCNAAKKTK